MKFYGTDSATAKAASKEGAFLIQTEILSSSGMISTPHEAKSTFFSEPKSWVMSFCHKEGKDTMSGVSWAILGPRCGLVMGKLAVVYGGK